MTIPDTGYSLSRFVCQRCGNCCKGDGVVRLESREVRKIARLLGISRKKFLDEFTVRTQWGDRWLIDKTVGQERWCIFLDRDSDGRYRCGIQNAKPRQCVGFPLQWRPDGAHEWCEGLKKS